MKTGSQRAHEDDWTEEIISSEVRRTTPPEPAPCIIPTKQLVVRTKRETTPHVIKEETEHLFQHAKDAAYAPPVNRNVGAPAKAPAVKKPAYRTMPPVHDPKIAADVYKQSMEAPITIMQQELLSISPEGLIPGSRCHNHQASVHRATAGSVEIIHSN